MSRRGRSERSGPCSIKRRKLQLGCSDLPCLQALGADSQLARAAVHHYSEGLQIGVLPPLAALDNTGSDAARSFGFAAPGYSMPGKGPLAADIAYA